MQFPNETCSVPVYSYRGYYHSECPEGFEFILGVCYQLTPDEATYPEAVAHCPTLYPGSILMEPRAKGVLLFHTLDNSLELWVGINDIVDEGTFVYQSDSSDFTLTGLWSSGEPNDSGGQDCAYRRPVDVELKLDDRDCGSQHRFYCQVQPGLEAYHYPASIDGATWNKWITDEITADSDTLCAQECSRRDNYEDDQCTLFAFIPPNRCFLSDKFVNDHKTAVNVPDEANVYIRIGNTLYCGIS